LKGKDVKIFVGFFFSQALLRLIDGGIAFHENGIVVAHPSKSGGDWWYGRNVSTGKRGLFPKTYVEVVKPCKSLLFGFVLFLYVYKPPKTFFD